MGRRPETVEEPGGGEIERTHADRRDSRPSPRGGPYGGEAAWIGRGGWVGSARHDHGVGSVGDQVEGVRDGEANRPGVRGAARAGDLDVVRGSSVRGHGASEDLDRGAEIEGDDPVESENGDHMHSAERSAGVARS